jgi:hypothetical protein
MKRKRVKEEEESEKGTIDIGNRLFADLPAYKERGKNFYNYMQGLTDEEEKDTAWEKRALKLIFQYIDYNRVTYKEEFKRILTSLKSLKKKYPKILNPPEQDFFYRGRYGFKLTDLIEQGMQFSVRQMLGEYLIIKVPLKVKVRNGVNSFTSSWQVATIFEGSEAYTSANLSLRVLPAQVLKACYDYAEKSYPYRSIKDILLETLSNFDQDFAGVAVVSSKDKGFILNPNFMDHAGDAALNESEILYVGSEYTTTFVGLKMEGMKPLVPKALAMTLAKLPDMRKDVQDLESEAEEAFQAARESSDPKVSNFIKILTQEFK